MKKLMFLTALLGFLFISCEKEEFPDLNPTISIGYSTNMGPLNTSQVVCGNVLSFEDESHFRSSYDYLESKYDQTFNQDSTKYLDFFEDQKNFKSLRTHVNHIEKQMIAQNITITDQNDPDTTFFEDDVMKTLLNEDKLVVIGDTVILYLDECMVFKAPFEDCRGVGLLSQLSMLLNEKKTKAAEQFIFENQEIEITNICDTNGNRSNCGILADIQTSFDWVSDPDNVIVTLDAHAYSDRPIIFRNWNFRYESGIEVLQGELIDQVFDVLGIPIRIRLVMGRTVILKVPRSKDYFEVSYRASNLKCSDKAWKRINIACGINVNRTYGSNDQVTFSVDHNPAYNITSFNWTFGDGFSGTGSTVTHQYTYTGCGKTFTAYLNPVGNLPPACSQEIDVRVKLGWNKYRSSGSITRKEDYAGKKVKWKIKQNSDRFLGKNKIKAKMKVKRGGRSDLKINFSGNIYLENSNCAVYSINGIPQTSANNKRRLKNVYKRNDVFKMKLTDIYSVHFDIDNTTFTKKLQASNMDPE